MTDWMISTFAEHVRAIQNTLGEGESAQELKIYVLADTTHGTNLQVEIEARATQSRFLSLSEKTGPMLALCGPIEPLHEWLLNEGHGKDWHIIILSTVDFDNMWDHLRRFTTIYDHMGAPNSFRYYDPSVFNRYLPMFSGEQRVRFFHKIVEVIAQLGEHFMAYQFNPATGALQWRLLMEKNNGGVMNGEMGVPNIDLTESSSTLPFHFSKLQYEFPVLINMPDLIKDIDAYLRSDYGPRMDCFLPGLLRAMLESGARTALSTYKLHDLEIVRDFADLQWRIGPGFHKQPAIKALLSDPNTSAADKWGMLQSGRYDSALVEAFGYAGVEHWDLPIPIPQGSIDYAKLNALLAERLRHE